jgi:hypothetical protein
MIYYSDIVTPGTTPSLLVAAEPLDRTVHLAEENGSSYVGFSSTTVLFPAAVGTTGNDAYSLVLPADTELWALGASASAAVRVLVTSVGR